MSKLSERLREAHPNSQQYALGSNILLEAAQEIESLQAKLYEARAECVDPLEQSQQVQGEVVAYYDPRPGVDWAYRFLEPDEIEQEDNRNFFTVPLIANQPAPAAVPEGYAILPKELTAENGAKNLLIGEFYSEIVVPCPDCEGGDGSEDYDCGFCNSSGTVTERVPVSWTTIKEIWRKAAIALAAPAAVPDEAFNIIEGWIKCSERLPDEANCHLLMAADSGLVVSTFYSELGPPPGQKVYVDEISARFAHAAKYGYTVTHWMPLPEPPQQEEAGR